MFGLLGAWAKLSKNYLAQKTAAGYTTIVRGVPDLVLILLVFYGGQELVNSSVLATGLWDYVEISQFAGVRHHRHRFRRLHDGNLSRRHHRDSQRPD